MRKFIPLVLLFARGLSAASPSPDEFTRTIRPILAQNCSMCHNSANPKGPVDFLKAQTSADVEKQRGVWRNVAAQLRNRTMPPVASKLTEQDRQMVAMWLDRHLQQTACSGQDYAGAVTIRRLNRRDYGNTIRDLLGVELDMTALFPEDGSGGEGFDTDGETLFVPPLMTEKYMDAAQQILNRVVITPPFSKTFSGADLLKSSPQIKDGKIVRRARRGRHGRGTHGNVHRLCGCELRDRADAGAVARKRGTAAGKGRWRATAGRTLRLATRLRALPGRSAT